MAKRRGNNEGSIYQRKNGTWSAQVSVNGNRLSYYGKTQAECRQWIKETVTQVDAGITFEGARYRVSEYLEEWLKSIKGSIRQNTWFDYRQLIKNHIDPTLGKIKLKDLKPSQIQVVINAKREEGYSPWTLQFIRRVLNTAMGQAVVWGMITNNPVKGVKVPRSPQQELSIWTKEQVKIFLDHVEGTRFEALYFLAVTTGLRQGELLGLMWSDIDWGKKRLSIKRQLRQVRGKGLIFQELKTKTAQRVIFLGDSAILKLEQHRTIQDQQKLIAGSRWQDQNIVFPSTIGTPLGPRNLYRQFINTTEKTGLPRIKFHDLRHTAATLMLKEGIHPKVVQERLGHSSITLTLDVYSHVIPSMQEEVAEKLDGLLQ